MYHSHSHIAVYQTNPVHIPTHPFLMSITVLFFHLQQVPFVFTVIPSIMCQVTYFYISIRLKNDML